MAKLSIEQIEHIAKLSRLELSDDEKKRYSEQLSSVLDYVEQLKEVDTENVEPTANVTGLSNVWREDEIEESGIKYSDIEKNAPEFKDGNFIVPGVFE
jgi:aspartyl-tRNA(Asn)/glutamyl-tRNA(Gln) amidotransferase subunit C